MQEYIALVEITNIVLNIYNTNESWVVKKMTSEYANRITAILPIIYQKDKVQYFNNKFAMMISRVDHGEMLIGLPLCILNWSKNWLDGKSVKKL